jgi:hypothetical protein
MMRTVISFILFSAKGLQSWIHPKALENIEYFGYTAPGWGVMRK